MRLSFSKSINQPPCPTAARQYSEAEIQQMVSTLMGKLDLAEKAVSGSDSGELEIKDVPDLKMHSLMLRAEEMGLSLRCTRKTVIEIC